MKCVSCKVDDECEDRDLFLMENLHCGMKKLRFCDLKIGNVTAVSGWQGKSSLGAMSNRVVDMMTNSVTEGYRMEGMDGQPSSLESRLHFYSGKKSQRLFLQGLMARKMLR